MKEVNDLENEKIFETFRAKNSGEWRRFEVVRVENGVLVSALSGMKGRKNYDRITLKLTPQEIALLAVKLLGELLCK